MLPINKLSTLNSAIVYGDMRKYHALKLSERKFTLYEEENKNTSNGVSLCVKAQHLGGKLSATMLPNLGAFMGRGTLTVLGIWLSNDILKTFISPVFTYLLLLLAAISRGKMMYGEEGTVVSVFTTMEVITGADVFMLLRTMMIAPLSAWLLKKLDVVVEPLTPVDFELLIGNLTVALSGVIVAIIGCVWIVPAITSLSVVFFAGVPTLENSNLLPLTTTFIEPAKVLFLDNVTGQGILTPLGTAQLNEFGRSVLLLLESNPGSGLGVLLVYCSSSKGNAKANAYRASIIYFFGGTHEIYFLSTLMNSLTTLAAIIGGITSTFLFTLFSVGLAGVSSPGSVITIMMMASVEDQLLALFVALTSTAISSLVATTVVKHSKQNDGDVNKNLKETARQIESLKGKKSRISSVFEEKETVTDFRTVKYIVYVCDTGMGLSVMGTSVITKWLREAGITGITVEHAQIMELPDPKAGIIVTYVSLRQVAHEKQPDTEIISIEDYLDAPEYDELINGIRAARSQC